MRESRKTEQLLELTSCEVEGASKGIEVRQFTDQLSFEDAQFRSSIE